MLNVETMSNTVFMALAAFTVFNLFTLGNTLFNSKEAKLPLKPTILFFVSFLLTISTKIWFDPIFKHLMK